MISPFDDAGFLPPGIHPATLAEIEGRFGCESELRRVQMESLRWMVDLARRAGVARIVLNSSFPTDTMDSNDVDCVLLVGRRRRGKIAAIRELRKGLPFFYIRVFDEYVNRLFAANRTGEPKGMIEVTQWT